MASGSLLRRGSATLAGVAVTVQALRFAAQERSETHTIGSAIKQFLTFDALRLASAWARQRHDEDCKRFAAVQLELLRERLRENAETAYGRDHRFSALAAEEDVLGAYRHAIPITTPKDYVQYVQRIADGEGAVMNAEAETMLGATSGTSGQRTLIPYTPTMQKTFFTRGILVVFDTLLRTLPDALSLQKTCKLAFAASWQVSPSGLRIGPASSGPKDKSFQRLLHLYSTPKEGYTISHDERAALYVHALFAASDRRLGIIEGNFINLPARLLSLVRTEGGRLARDIERGVLDEGIAARIGDRATVEALNAQLKPNAQRAAEVRAALSTADAAVASPGSGGSGLARRLWPELKLFLANGTGPFSGYARRLREGSGQGVPILSTILAASEGLMGVSLEPTADGDAVYCLVPRAMFFEFLPVAAAHNGSSASGGPPIMDAPGRVGAAGGGAAGGPSHQTLLANELTAGRDYELVVTNLGGLTRYRIGDVVRVRGFHHGAPLVEFRYRIGQVLNLRGEKLSELQLARAIASAIPADDLGEYAAAEQLDADPPLYQVFVEPRIEGTRAPTAGTRAEVVERLDRALAAESPVYQTWRQKHAIGAPEVCLVNPGGFERLRAVRVEDEGASPQQLKVSRVLRKPEHVKLLSTWCADDVEGEGAASPPTRTGETNEGRDLQPLRRSAGQQSAQRTRHET
jgi:auxin responsive GH3 family protein